MKYIVSFISKWSIPGFRKPSCGTEIIRFVLPGRYSTYFSVPKNTSSDGAHPDKSVKREIKA